VCITGKIPKESPPAVTSAPGLVFLADRVIGGFAFDIQSKDRSLKGWELERKENGFGSFT
jgi:hypothetical protein